MSQQDAIKAAEQEAEVRRRAARQAADRSKASIVEAKLVRVRVLKMGHDKISMGVHVGGVGEAHYERGETFEVAEDIALALEERGYVEIEDEVQPDLPQLDAGTSRADEKVAE